MVQCVLSSKTHPTADDVLIAAREKCPTVSRATVYNTLKLLVEKRLIGIQTIMEGAVVFDPNVEKHHHFVDEETGQIYDIPWPALEVKAKEDLAEFEISEYQVVMRGRRKKK